MSNEPPFEVSELERLLNRPNSDPTGFDFGAPDDFVRSVQAFRKA